MNPAKRREIFERFRAANPNPTTELLYGSPFELLVAVVLSAQATDKSVNLATRRLFPATPDKLVKLGVAGVEEYIKSIGLFRTKAKNVVALSQIVLDKHCGAVPQNRESLEALPGVGRKTANVVRSVVLGLPGLPVDTHVGRLSRLLGLTEETDPVKVEHELGAMIPAAERGLFSLRLILHGRRICIARKPKCPECLLAKYCPSAGTFDNLA